MSAGLPGLGLGGLFFVISALLAPAFELGRAARGRSSARAWRQVGRQFALALAMIVAVELALRGLLLAGAGLGAGTDPGGQGLTALPLTPIGITTALLLAVLLAAKCAQLGLRAVVRARAWRSRTSEELCPQACNCCSQART
jgi:hypothetical protein